MALRVGTKVEVIATNKVMYIQANKRGKPYPFYLHKEEYVTFGTPLVGPYGKDELREIGNA